MTTDLITVDLDRATTYAEELPDHTAQLARYEAAGLSAPAAWSLEARAAKIITIGRRGILEIGQELLAARAEAQYGTWGAFLIRCGVEERTAQNYMHVAEQFGDKPEMISALPATALYALAAPSADPVVVAEVVEEVRQGTPPSPAEIKQRLAPPDGIDRTPRSTPPDLVQAGLSLMLDRNGWKIISTTNGAPQTPTPYLNSDSAIAFARQRLMPPEDTSIASQQIEAPARDEPEEIATAALTPTLPPALPARPTALPPALPGVGATIGQGMAAETRKLLVSKRMLLQATLHLVEEELAHSAGPLISFPVERAVEAARLFLNNPALGGAAAMLAFSATVESEVSA